ncbi:diguanylate cyclase [Burkholderia multivorans]
MHPASVMNIKSAETVPVRSVLVVDDSVVHRRHTVALCRDFGIPLVLEASSGVEALKMLALLDVSPDLMIVDLEMPVMDGVELMQQLKQRELLLPLIIASGREETLIQSVETMAASLGIPVLAALQKPLTSKSLAFALSRFMQGIAATADQGSEEGQDADIPIAALQSAIVERQIRVHYQPKVDIRTGIVRGVEALARWQRRDDKFVSPARFIALAEREGLIYDLTKSVMRQAFAQAAVWNARGLRLLIAINLSPKLLDHPSLAQKILAMASYDGIAPDQVIFEITETSMVEYLGVALALLTRLRLNGFRLSIDDFGTGFSSMQQLARIPFTELKIDRSFVHGAHQRTNQQVILRSALEMARQLGLTTVAEGVETMDDWRLLQECGCDIGQGYLVGRPMPAGEIPKWIKHHQFNQRKLRAVAARTDKHSYFE